jgi:hypothetical protein
MKNVELLEEPKGILHLFRGNHFVEVHQASQQSADVAHMCHDNPSMETSFSQIGRTSIGGQGLPLLIGLVFLPDFFFNLGEMIIGITQRIVDLGRSQMRIGFSDSLNGVASLGALVYETDGDTSAHNTWSTSADRAILVHVAMLGLAGLSHVVFLSG